MAASTLPLGSFPPAKTALQTNALCPCVRLSIALDRRQRFRVNPLAPVAMPRTQSRSSTPMIKSAARRRLRDLAGGSRSRPALPRPKRGSGSSGNRWPLPPPRAPERVLPRACGSPMAASSRANPGHPWAEPRSLVRCLERPPPREANRALLPGLPLGSVAAASSCCRSLSRCVQVARCGAFPASRARDRAGPTVVHRAGQ